MLAILRTVEARGALDISRRIKQHVSQIYRFAIPQGWADQDPAAYLSDLLKAKPRVWHMARVSTIATPLLPIGVGYAPCCRTTSFTIASLSMKK